MPKLKQVPPKYVQISDHLRARIVEGQLRPGDEVPSERQLAAEWKVARPTATKALDVLRREGYVAGRQGAGTFVTDPNPFHRRANERYVRSAETGRIYPPNERARILVAERVEAPDYVGQALDLQPSTAVVQRKRLTLRDGEPVELSTSWYDASIGEAAPRLVKPERILQGTIAYVESSTGRRASSATDRISARLADDDELELLGLPAPSAVLVTDHVVRDSDGAPLEYTQSVVPPGAWTVEHEYVIR